MQFSEHKTLERSRETLVKFGEHNRQLKESRETAVHKESTGNLNLTHKEKKEHLNLVHRSTGY